MALTDFLQGIADAIRTKDGTTEPIEALKFKQRILDIPVNKVSQSGLSFTACEKINEDWQFKLITSSPTSNEYDSTSAQSSLSGDDFTSVNLPHDWSIYNNFNNTSKATYEGGYLDGGDAWYKKTLTITDDTTDNRYFLYFEGVYMESDVIVNGTHLNTHKHGYTNFIVEITDVVRLNEANEILVYVKNRQPSSRWYSGSGIYRDVFLLKSGKVGFKQQSIKVTTPNLEAEHKLGYCNTNVEYVVENTTDKTSTVTVEAIIKYFGMEILKKSFMVSIDANSEVTKEFTALVSDPKLWDEYDGQYYTLTLNMYNSDDKIASSSETYYGYRYFKFDPNTGFWLNGKNIKLRGACMHHDLGCLGAEINQSAIDRQILKLKDAGFNAIRLTHNPSCAEFTNACMRMGILCIEEAFDCWTIQKKTYDYARFFLEYAESDIKSMVKRSLNNPCVIAWSLGNEIYDTRSSNASKVLQDPIITVRNLRNWVREIDTTRPCTLGENAMYDETAKLVSNELDIQGINYGTYGYHNTYQDWCLYGSETTSAISSRCEYARDDTNYQCSSYDDDKVSWGSYAYKQIDIMTNTDYCAGMFIWTGWDYIGEPTPFNKYPARSSYFGIIDIAGLPKDAYYLYQSMWTVKPMCHIVPMDWSKWTVGDNVRVMVYSNAASVKMYLNGDLVGTYSNKDITDATSRGSFYGDIPFQKGRLVANAYDADGNLIAQDVIYTADVASKLSLKSEKLYYKDFEDLLFVEVDVRDKYDHLCTFANNTLTVEIQNGTIIGLDNGDATSVLPYRSASKPAFHGKAIAVIRPDLNSSSVTVTAKSEGLTDSVITINRADTSVYTKDERIFIDATEPYEFIVTEYPCESIVLNTSSVTLTPDNSIYQLIATIMPENCSDTVSYESSNSSVAIVNSSGLITLVNDGTCEITVRCGFKTAVCAVTVSGVSVDCDTITLSETSITLTDKSQYDITATVTPENCTYEVSWSSEDDGVVTIDNGGHMTAVANGTTNIIATCGSKSASCSVTVSLEEANVPCTSIQLNSDTLTFTESGSQTLTCTVIPENTTDTIIWSSDNESVATVSDGIVTAVGNGSCTITVTCGNYSDTCLIEVSGIVESDWTVEWNGETDSLPVGMTANENCIFVLNDTTGKYELATVASGTEANVQIDDSVGKGILEVELESSNYKTGKGWHNGITLCRVSGYRQVLYTDMTAGPNERNTLFVNSYAGKTTTSLNTGETYKLRLDNTAYNEYVVYKGVDIYVNDELVYSNSGASNTDAATVSSNVWTTSADSRIKAIRYKKVTE